MVELRRIDPLATAKIVAIVRACLAIVFGIPFGLWALSTGALSVESDFISIMNMSSINGLLLSPVVAAVYGYVTGLVLGLAYNWVSSRFGGISITLVRIRESEEGA